MKKIKRFSYLNAEVFKYENARTQVDALETGEYGIQFKIRTNDLSPRSFHIVKRDKIVMTGIRLSKEAALSIMVGLQELLRKDGVI